TAQYRPYRGKCLVSPQSCANLVCCVADEDCVDGTESEHIGWHDHHEPGVQIYEKTTEEIPFARRRRSLLVTVLLSILVGSICFLVGFFSHSSHSECISNTVSAHI